MQSVYYVIVLLDHLDHLFCFLIGPKEDAWPTNFEKTISQILDYPNGSEMCYKSSLIFQAVLCLTS